MKSIGISMTNQKWMSKLPQITSMSKLNQRYKPKYIIKLHKSFQITVSCGKLFSISFSTDKTAQTWSSSGTLKMSLLGTLCIFSRWRHLYRRKLGEQQFQATGTLPGPWDHSVGSSGKFLNQLNTSRMINFNFLSCQKSLFATGHQLF